MTTNLYVSALNSDGVSLCTTMVCSMSELVAVVAKIQGDSDAAMIGYSDNLNSHPSAMAGIHQDSSQGVANEIASLAESEYGWQPVQAAPQSQQGNQPYDGGDDGDDGDDGLGDGWGDIAGELGGELGDLGDLERK